MADLWDIRKVLVVAIVILLTNLFPASTSVPATEEQQVLVDVDPYGTSFSLSTVSASATLLTANLGYASQENLTSLSVVWAGYPENAPNLDVVMEDDYTGSVLVETACEDLPYEGLLDIVMRPGGRYTIPIALAECTDPGATTIQSLALAYTDVTNSTTNGDEPDEFSESSNENLLPNDGDTGPTRPPGPGLELDSEDENGPGSLENVGVFSSVTITGTIKTAAGVRMSNVWVRIYDQDTLTRDLYGSDLTNSNGFFSITVPCETDAFGGHIDPRVRVTLSNSAWRLEDPDGNIYERWVNMGDNVACTTHSAGSIRPPANANDQLGWSKWEEVERSWTLAVGEVDISQVRIRIPEASTTTGFYRVGEDRIFLGQLSSDETLHHEYGHYVHDMALGNTDDLPGPGEDHNGCTDGQQDKGLALTEGWAHFWASLLSTRYRNNCIPLYGQSNEADVFQIFYDMCDDQSGFCNRESGTVETWDWVTDSNVLSHSISGLASGPQRLGDMKWELGLSRPRDFTVASKQNGFDHNQRPSVTSFWAPPTGTWLGKTFTVGVYVTDPDTLVDEVKFSLKNGNSCSGNNVKENRGAWSFSKTYTAPSNIESKQVRMCATPEDELERIGVLTTSDPIWVDTKSPTATASVDHPPLSTSWTVSWVASDGGSGVQTVWIYEQDPLETTWELIHTTSSASGSFSQGPELGNAAGPYCYKAISRDVTGNTEVNGNAEACSNVV